MEDGGLGRDKICLYIVIGVAPPVLANASLFRPSRARGRSIWEEVTQVTRGLSSMVAHIFRTAGAAPCGLGPPLNCAAFVQRVPHWVASARSLYGEKINK